MYRPRQASKQHWYSGPDHRWQRVQYCVAKQVSLEKEDLADEVLLLAWKYLTWRRFGPYQDQPPPELAPMAAVVHLFEESQRRQRWLLEACLWTDASLETIAQATGLPVTVVEWYAHLCHDVSGLSEAGDARMRHLLKGRHPDDLSRDDEDFFLSFYAWTGGWLVLLQVRQYYDYRHELSLPLDQRNEVQKKRRVELLQVHAVLLLRTLPPSHIPPQLYPEIKELISVWDKQARPATRMLVPIQSDWQDENLVEKAIQLSA